MPRGPSVLRLFLLDDRRLDLDHVSLIVDRLAACRSVDGVLPEWRVHYETADISEAMQMCADDLEAIDPRWREIFDFSALSRARIERRGIRQGSRG